MYVLKCLKNVAENTLSMAKKPWKKSREKLPSKNQLFIHRVFRPNVAKNPITTIYLKR